MASRISWIIAILFRICSNGTLWKLDSSLNRPWQESVAIHDCH
jgi:hypothetical protein